MKYRTSDGDVLDAIAWKVYGREGMVTAIYEANPGLADIGPLLPAGLLINLPEPPAAMPAAPMVRLWGAA